MVTGLQLPMTSSFPRPTPSLPAFNRRCFSKIACAKIPFLPADPADPFLSKLASVAAKSPEKLLNRPSNSDTPPFLDVFESPQLMATPAQVYRSASYNEHRSTTPPPDLPSIMLDGRIVYIGMPLVSAVTELVLAQLMYLQWLDSTEPIYFYINSTGITRGDGETVALEANGFAIYDAMMVMDNEIHTVGIGHAVGHACLLLAAGTKGKRCMLPHAKAMLHQPNVPSTGLKSASDVLIRAKEAVINRDTLVKLLAKHTGNSVETVAKVMRGAFYMDSIKAKKFGVIDKILWDGQEQIMADIVTGEEWDEKAGIGI